MGRRLRDGATVSEISLYASFERILKLGKCFGLRSAPGGTSGEVWRHGDEAVVGLIPKDFSRIMAGIDHSSHSGILPLWH